MKKEYTQDKGPHIHAAFFFDGQKVQKSTHKAEQIGQYWQKNITNGKGSYHNCHRNRYERNGIGMLEHNDKEKRKRLDEDVISYLCKDDPKQDITQLKTTKRAKAFVRGTLPKGKKKVGRPRKEEK